MSLYEEWQVPVFSTLAKEFVLFDNWFSSLPGPTDPNKMFLHAATSGSNTAGCMAFACRNGQSGFPIQVRSIFENLEENDFTYDIHYMDWADPLEISPVNENKEKFI